MLVWENAWNCNNVPLTADCFRKVLGYDRTAASYSGPANAFAKGNRRIVQVHETLAGDVALIVLRWGESLEGVVLPPTGSGCDAYEDLDALDCFLYSDLAPSDIKRDPDGYNKNEGGKLSTPNSSGFTVDFTVQALRTDMRGSSSSSLHLVLSFDEAAKQAAIDKDNPFRTWWIKVKGKDFCMSLSPAVSNHGKPADQIGWASGNVEFIWHGADIAWSLNESVTVTPTIRSGVCLNENDGDNGGDENGGDENSGDENSGDENSGDENSGDENSGDENGGDENSGDENSGDENSGDENSGGGNGGGGNGGGGNGGGGNGGGGHGDVPKRLEAPKALFRPK